MRKRTKLWRRTLTPTSGGGGHVKEEELELINHTRETKRTKQKSDLELLSVC